MTPSEVAKVAHPRPDHTAWGRCECLDCRIDRAVKRAVAEAVEEIVNKARDYLRRTG